MLKVASRAELGGKPPPRAAAPAPAPKPTPKPTPAPQPKPAPAKPAPAQLSPVDAAILARLDGLSKSIAMLGGMVAANTQRQMAEAQPVVPAPAPAPVAAAAPQPAPAPATPLMPAMPVRAADPEIAGRGMPSIRMPAGAAPPIVVPPIQPVALTVAVPEPEIPTEATIGRDRQDRIESVVFGAARATIQRDGKKIMQSIRIERDGRVINASVVRDKKGRIERLTINE